MKHHLVQIFTAFTVILGLFATWFSTSSTAQKESTIRIEISPDVWSCFPTDYTNQSPDLAGVDLGGESKAVITQGAEFFEDKKLQGYCLAQYQLWQQSSGNTWSDIYPESVELFVGKISFANFYAMPVTQQIYKKYVDELVTQGGLNLAYIYSGFAVPEIGELADLCNTVPALQDDFPQICDYPKMETQLTEAVAVFDQISDHGGAEAVSAEARADMQAEVANGLALFAAVPRWP